MKNKNFVSYLFFACLILTSAHGSHAQIPPAAIPYLQVRTAGDIYIPLTAIHAVQLPKVITSQPCVRYNNFWCLKGTQWDGQIKVGEQHLAIFSTPVYSARAFAVMIKKYYRVYKLKTPRTMLSRFILSPSCAAQKSLSVCKDMWARVDKYSVDLAGAMGIAVDEDCGIMRPDGSFVATRARILFRALAHQESGITLQVNDALVDEGIKASGIAVY